MTTKPRQTLFIRCDVKDGMASTWSFDEQRHELIKVWTIRSTSCEAEELWLQVRLKEQSNDN